MVKWVHDFAERRHPARRPGVGRARGNAVADHRRGRQDRPLQLRLHGQRASRTRAGCTLALASEELCWGDAGHRTGASWAPALAVSAIFSGGTPEQRDEWLPQCYGTPGDLKLACLRGVRGRCRVRRVLAQDPGRVRRGQGRVGAQRHQDLDHQRWSGQPARRRRPGRSRARRPRPRELRRPGGDAGHRSGSQVPRSSGIRASHTAEVILDDCRVPGSCLLGGKEKLDERLARAREGGHSAAQAAMGTFEASRPYVAAQAVGVARAAYEYALDYAKERQQFGRAIIENQAISFTLADMRTRLDAARLLRVAGRVDGTQPVSRSPAPRAPSRSCSPARPRCGSPSGPSRSWAAPATSATRPVERWYRDAKIYTIFEGTSEIQRLVIAPGDLRAPPRLSGRLRAWSRTASVRG